MKYVLYHASCSDGFGAALAAWVKFGSDAKYIPVQYQQDPPEMISNSEIYIVDFSYPLATLQKLQSQHQRVLVIDHHKTAKQALLSYRDSIFDLEKSGAMLSWEYFHPDSSIPYLIRLIQDRDLWKWKYPETEMVGETLRALGYDFQTWKYYLDDDKISELSIQGEILLKAKNKTVESILENSYMGLLPDQTTECPMVNSPIYQSELAQELMDKYDTQLACIWYQVGNETQYSLRSRGNVDCSEIALKFGGGGHPQSAGFRFSPPN